MDFRCFLVPGDEVQRLSDGAFMTIDIVNKESIQVSHFCLGNDILHEGEFSLSNRRNG